VCYIKFQLIYPSSVHSDPLVIVIDLEGDPFTKIAAAARLGPGIWHGFHKFVLRRDFEIENDWWSVEHLHGLGLTQSVKLESPKMKLEPCS